MSISSIKKMDHLGIVAGVIKDLKIVEMIDKRIAPHFQEKITTGEAIAAMIINGLGFSDRPLSLTPQFFESKAIEKLFRLGVEANDFNRHKLGRSLDDIYNYDCNLLFAQIAKEICKSEGIETTFNSLDTTTFSVTGEYIPDSDENVIELTHGYSKDHRPDLKQAVLELISTQDGGIPLMMQTFDGDASDVTIFKERSKQLIREFKESEEIRYLIADSKLYCKDNQESLKEIGFITRIPRNIKEEGEVIDKAWERNKWQELDAENHFQTFEIEHYGIKQRWVVIHSRCAEDRSEKSIEKKKRKEFEAFNKAYLKLSRKKFGCSHDAEQELYQINKNLKYHKPQQVKIIEIKKFKSKGRPKKEEKGIVTFKIECSLVEDKEVCQRQAEQNSCYVLGSNIATLSEQEIVKGYKGQSSVELGFRFLKDPLFFASSFFIKKASRISALIMVMTLALLVYSIAQRKMRHYLNKTNQTLPNQIRQPTKTPTLRWIFQMMDGIYVVTIKEKIPIQTVHGISELQRRIIKCFGPSIEEIYGVAA